MASASMRSIETGSSKLLRSERVAVITIEGVPEDSPCADPVWAPAGRAKVPAPRASRAAGHEAVIRCAIACCESRRGRERGFLFVRLRPASSVAMMPLRPVDCIVAPPRRQQHPGKGGYSMLPAPFRSFISLASALVCALTVLAAQAQAPAAAPPSWQQGRNAEQEKSPLHPFARYDGIESRLDRPPEAKVVVDGLDPQNQPGHFWKFLALGPDGKLYYNVGAPGNIVMPAYFQAAISRVDPKTGVIENYAQGV